MPWLHAVIDVPHAQLAGAAGFWGRVHGWPAGDPWEGAPELRSFVPPAGTPYVHLQEIGGPPRVHLDLAAPEPDVTVERARALGAGFVADRGRWQTLTSPGGLPFCVVGTGPEERPAAVTWPDGHRSRTVQLCIDSPVAAHEREVAFWRELLGGRWVDSAAPEFAGPGILVPTTGPLLRWCLQHNLRVVQPLTLMSLGLYNEPMGAYLPSVLY